MVESRFYQLTAPQLLTPAPLHLSLFLTLHALTTSRLRTRTPHSEVIFRLHPNNNINDSYRTFGITPTTTHLIAIKLGLSDAVSAESVGRHLGDVVKGTSVRVGEEGAELGMWGDEERVRKVYKIGLGGGKGKKGRKEVEGEKSETERRKEMESVILGIMTLKGS